MIVGVAAGHTDQHPLHAGGPMRKLAVNTFVSLDGVMQAPGGPEEDPTGGFTRGGWSANYFDDEMMGPIADRLNSTRKHVASTTLKQVEWNNSTLITGDVAEYVTSLKRQDGPEIQVHGSPGLIQTLLEHDLIDEFRVWIFPVVLGAGKRLYGDGTIPAALKLIDSKVSTTGVTINTYERAGDIDVGSFEFDEPTEAEIERRQRLAAA